MSTKDVNLSTPMMELIRAARAWDEYDGGQDAPAWIAVQQRLQTAYRQFTRPYAEDAFYEGGIIVSECTESYCESDGDAPAAGLPDSSRGSCHD